MQDVIYKLRALQSIEPDEAWQADRKRKLLEKVSVFGVRNDIFLSSNDIYAQKTRFDIKSLFPNRLAVSLTSLILVLTSGVLTVGASQSSLPGDTLYPVKKASEQVALAVASDQDKPKIEIEQAGKRLEELAQISQKASDSDQHQKVQQLVAEFQEKVDSASTHLSQLNDKGKNDTAAKGKVVNVAMMVTEQSEKYTEVLQKTTANLPDTIKVKVAEQVADATKTAEKVNISALMVVVDNKQDADNGDIAAKVQKTVEKVEGKLNEISDKTVATAAPLSTMTGNAATSSPSCSANVDSAAGTESVPVVTTDAAAMTEEAIKELERAKENLKNNNLIDTLKSVAAVTEITDKVSFPVTGTVVPSVDPATTAEVPETTVQSGN